MSPADLIPIEFASFTLLRPWWLLALPPAWALLWKLARNPRPGSWTEVVDTGLLSHVVAEGVTASRRGADLLLAIGITVAVLALAGPAVEGRRNVALRGDATRVLVADLSPALDGQRNGIPLVDVLRVKLLDLLARMPDGQTALIAYGEEPFLIAPPTTDGATLRMLVGELAPDILPVAGNRPERALSMAADVLARSGAAVRDIVWLNANAEVSAPTLQAVGRLGAAGARVSLLRLAPGNDAPAVTSGPLHDAVRASGGLDLVGRTNDTDVSTLLAHLDRASPLRETAGPTTSTPYELGPWLLAVLSPFAALLFRRGVLAVLVMALLLPAPRADAFDAGHWWRRPDQLAMRALRAGSAAEAAAGFTDSRWKAVAYYRAGSYAEAAALLEPYTDADSLYNRGNALARLQRLEEALSAYESALRLRPADSDILHNRDLVRELIRRPPPPQSGQDNDGEPPPQRQPRSPSSPPPAPVARGSTHEQEAAQLAEQWLRRVPDEPAGLLRRKLELEHRRRQSGEVPRPW